MVYLALEDKLNLAPVENPQMVLDVGTGTGIWAMYIPFHDNPQFIITNMKGTEIQRLC